MNACDVFAMPNREIDGDNEGFGMVFIEAAACGKPSLAGQAGGTGSAVLHDETGLRVNGNDIEAVTAGLRTLLTQPERAIALGEAGWARVQSRFAWAKVAEATQRVITIRGVE